MSKHDLIDMIITEKNNNTYLQEDDDLSKEKANYLLKNNKISNPI